jgi:outer membrane protein assembly factor BamB
MVRHDLMTIRLLSRHAILASVLASLIATLPVLADEWPQWRGPDRNGKSSETGLLQEWPEQGPPLAWKASGIGTGYSSVSVAGHRIFTMGDLEDGQYVFALKEDGGKLLWKTRVGPIHKDKRGGPRSTPTVDGDRVYVLTTEGSVVCLEVATGNELWRRSLPDDFGGYLMKAMGTYDWKFSESPLVDGDRVVVTPGHIEAFMVALNKKNGEEVWRTQGRRVGPRGADGTGYASAVISEAGGIRHYAQLVGRGLIGVDAETGRLLWSYNRVASDIANIATPIVQGDHVFASTGYGTGAGLVKIRRDGDEYVAEEVYFLEADTLQNHHGGLILQDGTLFTGTGHNKGFPIAVNFKTGEVAWGPVRNAGSSSAAVSYADGRLYFRYQDGRMILVDASAREYRERGTFLIPDVVKESWAHPVISNGKLLLREQDVLYCYDIAAKPPATEEGAPAS